MWEDRCELLPDFFFFVIEVAAFNLTVLTVTSSGTKHKTFMQNDVAPLLDRSNSMVLFSADHSRPCLSTPASGCNDYINAVFLPVWRFAHSLQEWRHEFLCTVSHLILKYSDRLFGVTRWCDCDNGNTHLGAYVAPFYSALAHRNDPAVSHQRGYSEFRSSLPLHLYVGLPIACGWSWIPPGAARFFPTIMLSVIVLANHS